jgi:hypothetical protein
MSSAHLNEGSTKIAPETTDSRSGKDTCLESAPSKRQSKPARRGSVLHLGQVFRKHGNAHGRRHSVMEQLTHIEGRLARIKSETSFLLHPLGLFMHYWDILAVVCLFFTAMVTPYEIALFRSVTVNKLFIINRVVDFVFTVDIFVNFRLMYHDNRGGGQLVRDKHKIIRKYLTTWFPLDFLSVIPGYVDCIWVLYVEDGEAESIALNTAKLARVGRFLRLMRLVKMVRIIRVSRIMSRWITMVNFQFSSITLLKNLMIMILTTHWGACLWILLTQFEGQETRTWISDWALGQPLCRDMYESEEKVLNGVHWSGCYQLPTLYTASLYWAIMTLTSIGYGDVTPTIGEV